MSGTGKKRQTVLTSFFSPTTPNTTESAASTESPVNASAGNKRRTPTGNKGSSSGNKRSPSGNKRSPTANSGAAVSKSPAGSRSAATPVRAVNKRRAIVSSDEDTNEAKLSVRKRSKIECESDVEAVEMEHDITDELIDECSNLSMEDSFNRRRERKARGREGGQKPKVANVKAAAALIDTFAAKPSDFIPPDRSELLTRSSKCGKPKPFKELVSNDQSSVKSFPHLRDPEYDFLKPEHLQDAEGRCASDPDYDGKTLYVPKKFLDKQSPGLRQWWNIKSQNFDTVLLFKVGKFYELYHMDAVLGVESTELTYMKGSYAHAGFPEMAYGRFADQLVSCGYKVARIEQTETPKQKDKRRKTSKVKDNVVARELCRVTTQATRTYGVLDTTNETDSLEPVDSSAKYLIALSEKVRKSGSSNISISEYGVCIVDTSTGRFLISLFTDDECHSYLRTVLAQHPPLQVLYEKGRSSKSTQMVLNSTVGQCQKEGLVPNTEFWTCSKTVDTLCGEEYFGRNLWPEALASYLDDPPSAGGIVRSKPNAEMAFCALGAVIWYLKRCLIDVDLLTMRNFALYDPIGELEIEDIPMQSYWKERRMVLDCSALTNLNLVGPLNSKKQKSLRDPDAVKYSLYNTINKCATAFGKRQLRVWTCSPLCDPKELTDRQDAVEFLSSSEAQLFVANSVRILRKVPDLERLLQKIHTLGLEYRARRHPDSRAIFFEKLRYNKRKISDLVNTLKGFREILEIRKLYRELRNSEDFKGVALIERCFGSGFTDIEPDLDHFQRSFNQENAVRDGMIVPVKGMDNEYDSVCEKVNGCIDNLNMYLKQVQKELRCSKIQFGGTAKARFLLEIPTDVAERVGNEYELKSSKKGCRRYTTVRLTELFGLLHKAEEERDEIRCDLLRRVFADFDNRKEKWASVLKSVSTFDCLLSMAQYVRCSSLAMTRPEILFDSDEVSLEIDRGFHPSLAVLMSSSGKQSYIPNSTNMGGEHPLTILLTGPNMGGKSTLMRQVAVLVVLAQMGCFVPAAKMRFTPVDRIFTRIGASDHIMAGQSTFFVELSEAKTILRGATKHSLVIVDELGRGTSTFDGSAIASAVLKYIAKTMLCRCLFSTHYLSLCSDVSDEINVSLAHMACLAKKGDEFDITLLYTVAEGICPKSYGFHVAKLAGISPDIVNQAIKTCDSHDVGKSTKLGALRRLRNAASDRSFSISRLTEMIKCL